MPEHTVPADLDWTRAAPEDATGPGPWIEIAFGPDDHVYLRETSNPGNVVTTTRRKWDAFVLGVQAGEFDHFVEGLEDLEDPGNPEARESPEAPENPEAGRQAGGSDEAARPERAGRAEETRSTAGARRARGWQDEEESSEGTPERKNPGRERSGDVPPHTRRT